MNIQKILLVEDNAVEARGLTWKLELQGYTVVHATNAKDAMQVLRSEQPDLVLLDVGLPTEDAFSGPKWDGLGFLKWMRSMTDHSIPVIVLTGLPIEEVQRRLGDSRVAACFQKPVPPADLVAAVRSALDNNLSPPLPGVLAA